MTEDDPLTILSYAVKQLSKSTLKKLAQDHDRDVPGRVAAAEINRHIERAGFKIVRVRPPGKAH